MTFTLIYHSQVANQLNDIAFWYANEGEGLGDLFIAEFQQTIETIKRSPYAFAKKLNGSRQVKMNRFPYFVIYYIDESKVEVFNVIHTSRHPIRRIMKK